MAKIKCVFYANWIVVFQELWLFLFLEGKASQKYIAPSKAVGFELCEDVVVVASGAETPSISVPVQSFSSLVADKKVSSGPVVVRDEKSLPNQPLTALITPQVRLPASDVFTALTEANVDGKDVSCLQCPNNGQVVLTFHRVECKEQFLHKSVLKVGSTTHALQDVVKSVLKVGSMLHALQDVD